MRVYYTEMELPTGLALAAATENGLAHLELRPPHLKEWVGSLRDEYGVLPERDEWRFSLLRRELAAYFSGSLKKFSAPLDVHGTEFQEKVWKTLVRVPYGSVVTYGELAEMAGKHGAARAVGGAMHANRVPIIIPCHRVVASGGRLGGYGAGVDIKKRLLEIEGVYQ